MAEAHVLERVVPAHPLVAGLDVDLRGPRFGRDVIAAVDVDIDAADRVHRVGEAGEVDVDDVVDLEPGELLDHLEGLVRTALGVGDVELVDADPGDVDLQVTGDGEQRDRMLVGVDAEQDRGVGAAWVALRVEALVGADDQDRLRGAAVGLGELVAQRGERVVVGEPLGDVGEVEQDADRGRRGHRDHDHQRGGQEARPQGLCPGGLAVVGLVRDRLGLGSGSAAAATTAGSDSRSGSCFAARAWSAASASSSACSRSASARVSASTVSCEPAAGCSASSGCSASRGSSGSASASGSGSPGSSGSSRRAPRTRRRAPHPRARLPRPRLPRPPRRPAAPRRRAPRRRPPARAPRSRRRPPARGRGRARSRRTRRIRRPGALSRAPRGSGCSVVAGALAAGPGGGRRSLVLGALSPSSPSGTRRLVALVVGRHPVSPSTARSSAAGRLVANSTIAWR